MARRLFPRLKRLSGLRPTALDRRTVLAGLGASSLFACVKRDGMIQPSESAPRVAVVGAGLAGLSCATRLLTKDIGVTLYEANTRVGGRTFTDRTSFPRRTVDLGGEFVDSWHDQLRGLVSALGLELDDTWEDDGVSEVLATIQGDILDEDQLELLEQQMKEQILAALVRHPFDPMSVTYTRSDAFDRAIDAMSAAEWLDRNNIARDKARTVLEAGFVSLYGGGLEEASALVLLQEVIGSGPESDERFLVRGGAGQVAELLAQRFPPDVVKLQHRLVKVKSRTDGKVELTFDVAGQMKTETAEAVVLALPFSVLREVEIDAPLSPAKKNAITKLHYGAGSKLCVGFRGKPWRALDASGTVLSDSGFPYCWDETRMQDTEDGVITFFTGGYEGRVLSQVDLNVQRAGLIEVLNRVFPGVRNAAKAENVLVTWADEPFAKGGYALYAPGQVTSMRGCEGEPEGKLFFAGEHTSLEAQGYMEGAVRSGVRAAKEVRALLD
ncbi:MAG: FAD-dependent oxidoreductase [Myxococcales bacterium]|nr:FAD-dependent oxidoreductase [Myxococcales bacterium]